LVAATTVCSIGATSTAFAGEAESRTFFADGRQLRQAGKCAEAIPVFRKALETYPEGLGALRNIAECEEEIGRFASARRNWWDLRLAVLQSGSSKYAGWEKDAQEAHTRLGPRVARVTIRVKGGTAAHVYVNGRPLDPRLLGTELELDLGATEFSVQDGTASPPTQKLTLEEGKAYAVELEPGAPVPDGQGGAGGETGAGGNTGTGGAPPVVPEEPEPGNGLLIGGIVGLSVAGLAAVGLGVSIGLRQSALGTVEDNCTDLEGECRLSGDKLTETQDAKSQGETAAALVNVFAVTAGVAAGVGVSLLIASALQDDGTSGEAAVQLDVGPVPGQGAALMLRGKF
jgi:hypothetical protein